MMVLLELVKDLPKIPLFAVPPMLLASKTNILPALPNPTANLGTLVPWKASSRIAIAPVRSSRVVILVAGWLYGW